MKDLVERYFAAVNDEDWDSLAAVFDSEVEIHTTGARPAIGREAAVAHLRAVLEPFAEHRDVVVRWIDARATIVCEIAFDGRLRDGRAVEFEALDVFDGDDRAITRIGTWYDTRAVVRQIRG